MVSRCPPVAAAPQQPAATDLPVSLEQIRKGLETAPEGLLAFPPPAPLPLFRIREQIARELEKLKAATEAAAAAK